MAKRRARAAGFAASIASTAKRPAIGCARASRAWPLMRLSCLRSRENRRPWTPQKPTLQLRRRQTPTRLDLLPSRAQTLGAKGASTTPASPLLIAHRRDVFSSCTTALHRISRFLTPFTTRSRARDPSHRPAKASRRLDLVWIFSAIGNCSLATWPTTDDHLRYLRTTLPCY